MSNLSRVYVLENWSIANVDASPYTPPDARTKVAQGIVRGHPHIEDGERIVTSPIVEYDYPNRTIHTQNSIYRLGRINPDYVAYMRRIGVKPKTFRFEDFQ